MSGYSVLVTAGTSLCTRLLVHYLEGKDGISWVSAAACIDMALKTCTDTTPDVIVAVIDPCMVEDSPPAVADWLSAFPDSRVLALGGACDERTIAAALEDGACGYVCTCEPEETVLERIMQVGQGDFAVDGNVSKSVLRSMRRRAASDIAAEMRLAAQADLGITKREFEILALVAEGMTNRQIGASLGIAESTVKNHLNSLFEKMGVGCRSQAVSQAVRLGILDLN